MVATLSANLSAVTGSNVRVVERPSSTSLAAAARSPWSMPMMVNLGSVHAVITRAGRGRSFDGGNRPQMTVGSSTCDVALCRRRSRDSMSARAAATRAKISVRCLGDQSGSLEKRSSSVAPASLERSSTRISASSSNKLGAFGQATLTQNSWLEQPRPCLSHEVTARGLS